MGDGLQLHDGYDARALASLTQSSVYRISPGQRWTGDGFEATEDTYFATEPSSLTGTSGVAPGTADVAPGLADMSVSRFASTLRPWAYISIRESTLGAADPIDTSNRQVVIVDLSTYVQQDRTKELTLAPECLTERAGDFEFTDPPPHASYPVRDYIQSAGGADCPSSPEPGLHPLYAVRNESDVASYLQRQPGAVDDLAEIAGAIQEYFPGRAAAVSVLYDPEEPVVTLCVLIQAGRDAARANAQLDRFDKDWWFDMGVDMDPDICVDVEYR